MTAGAAAPPGLPGTDEIMRRAGGENFAVASRLLPRRLRSELLCLYGYARLVDELGDSYEGDRLAALDWLQASLHDEIDAPRPPSRSLVGDVASLVRQHRISRQPLLDLIEANRMDQTVHRYETAGDLYRYCSLSANPVGRLVLELFGCLDERRAAWSDSICTGLQLVEHWQDVKEDAAAGRVYLPAEDLGRFAVDERELRSDGPASSNLRSLIEFESGRARALLNDGAPLIRSLHGRLKFAVAGFAAGGHAALDALEARGFDPLAGATKPRRRDVLVHLARGLRGRG